MANVATSLATASQVTSSVGQLLGSTLVTSTPGIAGGTGFVVSSGLSTLAGPLALAGIWLGAVSLLDAFVFPDGQAKDTKRTVRAFANQAGFGVGEGLTLEAAVSRAQMLNPLQKDVLPKVRGALGLSRENRTVQFLGPAGGGLKPSDFLRLFGTGPRSEAMRLREAFSVARTPARRPQSPNTVPALFARRSLA